MDNLGYGKTIYIAGPMGDIHCHNFKRFFYWQAMLENSGYKVINPAEQDCLRWIDYGWIYTDDQYESVMKYDLIMIRLVADAVFALKGWEDSPGATREIGLAINLGKPVYYEELT